MKIQEGFILREVGGMYIAVPVGERSKHFHGMVNLNSTGAWLWKFFLQNRTQEEAVKEFTKAFEIDATQAATDVAAFVETLNSKGILE